MVLLLADGYQNSGLPYDILEQALKQAKRTASRHGEMAKTLETPRGDEAKCAKTYAFLY